MRYLLPVLEPKHKEFIRRRLNKPANIIAMEFNAKYGEPELTESRVRGLISKYFPAVSKAKASMKWTDIRIDYLKKLLETHKWNEIPALFNAHFKMQCTSAQIQTALLKRGVKVGIQRPEKLITFCRTQLPVGTIRKKNQANGEMLYIKVNNDWEGSTRNKPAFRKNWKPYHHYVWEQVNGAIPEKHSIIFLDGDKNNFNISNLICVSNKTVLEMAKRGWFTDNKTLNETAIKYCELISAMHRL